MPEPQVRFPAAFMRGGSSKGVLFHRRDLPEDRALWDPIFLAAIGSPDPYGRQLDGMGGGYSSVSKVVVMAPSARPDADVDYTFGQVTVGSPEVHYRTTCGNLMAAAAHFALDEGLVVARAREATVRIFDVNTRKNVVARFATEGGLAAVEGDSAVVGVAGSGAPVRLDFLDPGGAGTGRLLPSGAPRDAFEVPGLGGVDVSLVDAANPCVFVRAEDFGVQGSESPAGLNADSTLVARLEHIRQRAGVIMGFGPTPESIAAKNSPKVALVGRPRDCALLDGRTLPAEAMSLAVRLLTFGSFHPALPLTNAMCVSSAALIAGTVVHDLVALDPASPRRILVGTPAGVIPVEADVERDNSETGWRVRSATVFNTARRLMQGDVLVPFSRLQARA
ncbi:MAG TPA: PrpF domain-containing protein [Geminicoccaceae bacterium]|nr:PrpF domain-containing protein [Geminicoccaceae bacterium]